MNGLCERVPRREGRDAGWKQVFKVGKSIGQDVWVPTVWMGGERRGERGGGLNINGTTRGYNDGRCRMCSPDESATEKRD